MIDFPRVGVGVLIIEKETNKVLLGKRKGSHGESTWAPPGGKVDFNEKIEDCAKREVLEETGIILEKVELIDKFTQDFFNEEKEKKHFITVYCKAIVSNGSPEILEPDKCSKWDWFSWDDFPEELFLSILNLRNSGFSPFDQ